MEYDIETTALVHALNGVFSFAEDYVQQLDATELDELNDALDKLLAIVDQVAISRMEHNR